jgi:ubiquinone biosynthesis protein
VDTRALERDLSALIELYGNVALGDLSVKDVLTDVVGTAARHRLRMPTHLMLLIKALVTIEGVGLRLDPSFKMVEHAAPLAERLWRRETAPDAVGRRVLHTLQQTIDAVRAIPLQVEAIGRKIRDGRLEIRFVHRNLDHFVREMDRSSNRLAFAMIIAALIIGSSLIIQAGRGAAAYGYPVLGLAGFLVAGMFGIRLAIGIMRSGRL